MLTQKIFQEHLGTLEWFKPNLKILVACSGGADSICLLHLLNNTPDIELSVIHFDHQLRGNASALDRDFVLNVSEELGIESHVLTENINRFAQVEGLSIEEAGSMRRRSAFERLRKKLKFDYVATGQHFNDQIETILLNLYLGSGIQGLSGIGYISKNIVRPLLPFTQEDILQYTSRNHLIYRTDETNTELAFLRNNMRAEVIPLLGAHNYHQLHKVVQRINEAAYSLNSFVTQSAESVDIEEFNDDYPSKLGLGLTQLPDYFSPIQKAIFDRAFQSISLKQQGISSEHFTGLRSLFPDIAVGSEYHLPGSIRAVRDRSKIMMFDQNDIEWSETHGDVICEARFPFFQLESKLESVKDRVKDPAYYWFAGDVRSCVIRPFQSGDKIITDDGRTITVSQVLQAAKVAPHLKPFFPVMVNKDEIVWVPGIRTAKSAMVQEEIIEEEGLKHCIKVQFQKGTFE